jgi:hypothetical protein
MKKRITLTESELNHLIKKVINEISPDMFKRAIDVSKKRGTDIRTYKLGQTYLNKFVGKPLLGGTIVDIGIDKPRQGDYSDVIIRLEVPTDDGRMEYFSIRYDIDNDEYNDVGKIDRKDAVVLSKIAQLMNPETKYKQTGMHFKIKGWE